MSNVGNIANRHGPTRLNLTVECRSGGVNCPLRTSAVLVAQVREAPDVAESDAVSDARQQELDGRRPLDALLLAAAGRRSAAATAAARQRFRQLHVVHPRLGRLRPPHRRRRAVALEMVAGVDRRVDHVVGPRTERQRSVPDVPAAAPAQWYVVGRQHHVAADTVPPAAAARHRRHPTELPLSTSPRLAWPLATLSVLDGGRPVSQPTDDDRRTTHGPYTAPAPDTSDRPGARVAGYEQLNRHSTHGQRTTQLSHRRLETTATCCQQHATQQFIKDTLLQTCRPRAL